MKKTSIYFMIFGVLIMIIGCFIFQNLNHVNMVDSNPWTININGIRSFRWPIFTGFVLFMVGVIFNIASWPHPHHRYN